MDRFQAGTLEPRQSRHGQPWRSSRSMAAGSRSAAQARAGSPPGRLARGQDRDPGDDGPCRLRVRPRAGIARLFPRSGLRREGHRGHRRDRTDGPAGPRDPGARRAADPGRRRGRRAARYAGAIGAHLRGHDRPGRSLRADGRRRGPTANLAAAAARAFLGDGSAWIWGLHRRSFPTFVAIVNFLHALAHLFTAARVMVADTEGRWESFQAWAEACWNGRVDRVIAELRTWCDTQIALCGCPLERLADDDPRRIVARVLGYLEDNRERMDYPPVSSRGPPVDDQPRGVNGEDIQPPGEGVGGVAGARPVPKRSSNSVRPSFPKMAASTTPTSRSGPAARSAATKPGRLGKPRNSSEKRTASSTPPQGTSELISKQRKPDRLFRHPRPAPISPAQPWRGRERMAREVRVGQQVADVGAAAERIAVCWGTR